MRLFTRPWMAGALALSIVLPACASSGGSSGSAGSDSDVITQEELQADPAADLLTLIQGLRPRWMRGRGTTGFGGPTPPAVIVDGIEQPGRVDALRAIRATDVEEVRYMNARDATTRYGPGMDSGAILITRRRG